MSSCGGPLCALPGNERRLRLRHRAVDLREEAVRPQLVQAATVFERAARSRIRARHHQQQVQATRRAVKAILREPAPNDGALLATVLDALLLAVIAAQHWHRTRNQPQQAEAARQAADHLRAAYRVTAAEPLVVLRQHGTRLAESLRRRQEFTLRRALPELAEQILAEPCWSALAATLARAEAAGHSAASLLTEAAARRETDTAASVSEVLIWRLHRLADLTAVTTSGASAPQPAAYRPTTTATSQQRPTR